MVIVLSLVAGCATQTYDTGPKGVGREDSVQKLSPAEQKEQAYEIFKQLLELSDAPDRGKNLPQIKKLYREIIDKYPDVGLAQESYLRLVLLAKQERTESGDKEAEELYREFADKYPNSRLRRIIENELRSNG
jgi:hypothetical protein